MKKTININLNGIPFIIDEDAYQILNSYLLEVGKHFSTEEEKEIMKDIEARIAELFLEKQQKDKKIIETDDVHEIIKILGHPNEFESESEEEKKENEKEKTKKNNKFQKRFYRDSDNKKLGGVAAGLAAYFGKDVTIVRVILLVCALIPFLSGIVIPFYFITWLIAPEAITPAQKLEMQGEAVTIDNLKSQFIDNKNFTEPIKNGLDDIFRVLRILIKGLAFFIGAFISFVIFIIIFSLIISLIAIFFNIGIFSFYEIGFIQNADFTSKIFISIAIISIITIITCPLMGIKIFLKNLHSGFNKKDEKNGTYLIILFFISILMLGVSLLFIKTGNITPIYGEKKTQHKHVSSFHTIVISDGVKACIEQGSNSEIKIEGYKIVNKEITTNISDSVLYINGPYFGKSTAHIKVPNLKKIEVSGTSYLYSKEKLQFDSIEIIVDNASKINIDITSEFLSANVSNASKATLKGTAKHIQLQSEDASYINAHELLSKTGDIKTQDVSKIKACITDSIWLEANDLSRITYYENPVVVKTSCSDMSKIRKR